MDVLKLLLNDNRVNPFTQNNAAFRWAISKDHYDLVGLLLHYSRLVDHKPTLVLLGIGQGGNQYWNGQWDWDEHWDEPMRWALRKGHMTMVRLLLMVSPVHRCTVMNAIVTRQ